MTWRKTLKISEIDHLTGPYVIISVQDPGLASNSWPGMFFELRAPQQQDRLFKPLSIYDVAGDRLSFFIKVLGAGTKALADMKDGDELELIGPLGNTFPLLENRKALLVSGGVGYPPLAWLKKSLPASTTTIHLHGGAGKDDVFPCEYPCTDNGSVGHKGFVTDLVPELIKRESIDLVYSCGPLPMLKKLASMCGNIEHYASMEAYMACGVGVCYGCAIPVGDAFQRVCKEGPVFDARQIKWEEL